MGCDRNLFTLRLVLNQTRGEWQWQAAAEGWGKRGAGAAEKSVEVCHVTQVRHYNPPWRAQGHRQGPWDGWDGETQRARDV